MRAGHVPEVRCGHAPGLIVETVKTVDVRRVTPVKIKEI
jgi:hypothetical protein